MIADTRPIPLEPLTPRIRAIVRAGGVAVAVLLATFSYFLHGFMADFDMWSPAVHTRAGELIGPTPHDSHSFVRGVHICYEWRCEVPSVFQRHPRRTWLWLWAFGPDGFPIPES